MCSIGDNRLPLPNMFFASPVAAVYRLFLHSFFLASTLMVACPCDRSLDFVRKTLAMERQQCHPIHISEFIVILPPYCIGMVVSNVRCSDIAESDTVCASTFDCIDSECRAFNRSKPFRAASLNVQRREPVRVECKSECLRNVLCAWSLSISGLCRGRSDVDISHAIKPYLNTLCALVHSLKLDFHSCRTRLKLDYMNGRNDVPCMQDYLIPLASDEVIVIDRTGPLWSSKVDSQEMWEGGQTSAARIDKQAYINAISSHFD